MLEIYILFLVAPIVSHLGEYSSIKECQRVAQTISLVRHKGDTKEAATFGANRLVCVKKGE